jgi:hypothetical protein
MDETERYVVTLVVKASKNENTETDLLKYFKNHNSFQINQTCAEILVCGVKVQTNHRKKV